METLTSLLGDKGCPLAQQKLTWREMASKPISKLDDDSFTPVRIIQVNGAAVSSVPYPSSTAPAGQRGIALLHNGRQGTRMLRCAGRKTAKALGKMR